MTVTEHPQSQSRRTASGLVGRLARSTLYCAGLAPLSIAALIAVLMGRSANGAGWLGRWQRCLLGVSSSRQVSPASAVAGKAVTGLLLGALAVVPLAIEVLFAARGVLYGVVDNGPYDTSWGGPSLPGAWAAHFLVAVPFAVAGLLTLHGIATLHLRWGRLIDGERGGRWVIAVTTLAVAAAVLVTAWTHQI
jgi:hypothetical protein